MFANHVNRQNFTSFCFLSTTKWPPNLSTTIPDFQKSSSVSEWFPENQRSALDFGLCVRGPSFITKTVTFVELAGVMKYDTNTKLPVLLKKRNTSTITILWPQLWSPHFFSHQKNTPELPNLPPIILRFLPQLPSQAKQTFHNNHGIWIEETLLGCIDRIKGTN